VKILVVEDGLKVARFLTKVLHEEGFVTDICTRGQDAIHQITKSLYDLVVLDWMLPDIDGLSVCREIRRAGTWTPVMMLTARNEVHERVLGLESGADDYLAKPFEVEEFVARVHALIRRSNRVASLTCGALEIDRVGHRVSLGGSPLELSVREYALLVHLACHAENLVTRTSLLDKVWGTNFDTGSNVLDVQMSRLRDKMGHHSWMIETVRGFGYRLRSRMRP
jgi:DNA-binding response OmpR family regulator